MQLGLSFPQYATLAGMGRAHPAINKLLATVELSVEMRSRRWTIHGERLDFLEAQLNLVAAAKLISRPRLASAVRSVVSAIDDLFEKRQLTLLLPEQSPPEDI